jgi:hypothetical protein
VTAFFIPDTPRGKQTSRAYDDLREYAEFATGRPARPPRIFKLSYRRDGVDGETCVGTPAAVPDAKVVHAIFDIGDAYAILWRGGHEVLTKKQTYLAHEFD